MWETILVYVIAFGILAYIVSEPENEWGTFSRILVAVVAIAAILLFKLDETNAKLSETIDELNNTIDELESENSQLEEHCNERYTEEEVHTMVGEYLSDYDIYFVFDTDTYYHVDMHCNEDGRRPITLDRAVELGMEPCPECIG